MITQEQFDIILTGIRWQGGPSVTTNGWCRYRDDNERRCAIGWLIPDDKYSDSLEGAGALSVWVREAAGYLEEDEDDMDALQCIHDRAAEHPDKFFDTWERGMASFAHYHGLNYTPPAE